MILRVKQFDSFIIFILQSLSKTSIFILQSLIKTNSIFLSFACVVPTISLAWFKIVEE